MNTDLHQPPSDDDATDLIEPLDDETRFPHGKPADHVEDEPVVLTVPDSTRGPDPDGPFQLPTPSLDMALHARVVQLQLHERLRGHVTSKHWLPDDPNWPELAEVRAEQIRLRDQVYNALGRLAETHKRFASEDRRYEEAMREAQRAGRPNVGMEDPRTPETERVAAVREAEAWLFAGAEILAETVDACIAKMREMEAIWLGGLRGRTNAITDRRREIQDELDRLKAEEFALILRGKWLQATNNDDGILGRNPVPQPNAPTPPDYPADLVDTAFERPWHDRRDWGMA